MAKTSREPVEELVDDEDDNLEGASGEVTEEPAPTPAGRGPYRPRARVTPDHPVFGAAPVSVTHWAIKRQTPMGQWEPLSFVTPDGQVEVREFPIAELSVDIVRQRWGAGTYRVSWRDQAPNGGLVARGSGRIFTVPAAPVAAPQIAPSMTNDALPSGFASAIAIMNVIESKAANQIAAMGQLAAMMRQPGTDPILLQILQQQQAQTAALQQSIAALAARVDAADDGDDDDDDDEPSAAGQMARAAVPVFRAGKPLSESLKAAIGNYFVENPEKLVDIVKTVPQVLEHISKLGGQPQTVTVRPRAVVAAPAAAPPAPEPPPKPSAPPMGPGLNGHAQQQAKAAKDAAPEGSPARS